MSEAVTPAGAAAAAAALLGLPAPLHLRTGSRVVFAAGDDVVLRVGGSLDEAIADRAWFEMIADVGVRSPRPVAEPQMIDGHCVVAHERVHPRGSIDWAEVGGMVRRVHSIPPSSVLPSCTESDHWRFETMLDDLPPVVDDQSAAAMRRAYERHHDWRQQVEAAPRVTLHGDVHPGNVVPTARGVVVLDWDLRCAGPAQWDHAPLMTWTERWGGEAGIYEDFATGYGRSFRDEHLAETLAELRLLAATLMRVEAWRRMPDTAAKELAVRLQWWRRRDGAPAWTAQ